MAHEIEIFWELRQLDAIFRRAFFTVMEEQNISFAASHGHGKILHVLEQSDGLTQKELAAKLQIRPQSLTEALVRLEERGLIVRTHSEHDKRERFVSITQEGRAHSENLRQLRQKAAERVTAVMSEEEKQHLSNMLTQLIENYKETEERSGV